MANIITLKDKDNTILYPQTVSDCLFDNDGEALIVDNLTVTDTTKALSANQGKVLDGKISQLGQRIDDNLVSVSQNTLMLGLSEISLWASGTNYKECQQVNYNNHYYRCTAEHISGDSFDNSKWAEISNFIGQGTLLANLSIGENVTPIVSNAIIHLSNWGAGAITCPNREFLYYEGGLNLVLYNDNDNYKTVPYIKGCLYEYNNEYFYWNGYQLEQLVKDSQFLYPVIASYNNYSGNDYLDGAITEKGVWYKEEIQNMFRGLPIVSIVARFSGNGYFKVIKGRGINETPYNDFSFTEVQTFNIHGDGIKNLQLSSPLILDEDEWIGFSTYGVGGAKMVFQNSATTPSTGFIYTYNNWGYAELGLQVGINVATTYGKNESKFNGKRIAILGDSISTYQGWIPITYQYFYPDNSCPDVNDVNKTYWKIVADKLGLKITNASYSGSTCAVTGGYGVVGCSDERIAALGADGNPDIVLCFIGVNDWGYGSVNLGDWTPKQAIPTQGDTFANAYALMLSKIQIAYPNAKIFCATLLPDKARDTDHQWPLVNSRGDYHCDYNDKIREIAKGMGCNMIEFSDCGICWNTIDDFFGDYSATYGIHPNAAGHQKIAAQLMAELNAKY